MENINVKVEGNKLILTIDTTVDMGRSKSGKTNMVASSQGNVKVAVAGKELFIGLNCYTK